MGLDSRPSSGRSAVAVITAIGSRTPLLAGVRSGGQREAGGGRATLGDPEAFPADGTDDATLSFRLDRDLR
jgi:hypothetical protein